MRFTVAICTWNRAALLSRTLEQLTRVRRPKGDWEVLVVNNGSTDDTERAIDAFSERLPLRRAFEPLAGLSHARNRAVRDARGAYILWTDDDVLPDAGWFVAYERAAERRPEAAVFGGPVRPRFEGEPPRWLSKAWRDVGAAFAALDLGGEPFRLKADGELPYGANFVVRTSEQRRHAFDPRLGRLRDGGAVGEETTLIRAILSEGGAGWWVPDASVEHWIPRGRQTIRYLRSYYAMQGRTFHTHLEDVGPALLGRPLRPWAKILLAELAYRLARLSGNPHLWLKPLVQASIIRGSVRR